MRTHPLALAGANPPQRVPVEVGGGDSAIDQVLHIPFGNPHKATEAMHSLEKEWLEIINNDNILEISFIHHHFILFILLPFSQIDSSVITPTLLYILLLPCSFPSFHSPYTRTPSFLYHMYFPFIFPPFASY